MVRLPLKRLNLPHIRWQSETYDWEENMFAFQSALGSLAVLLPVALLQLPASLNLQVQTDDPQIAGIDHHQIINTRLSPYSAIGKLKGTMTCTAAIVLDPRIIVTAAHCVMDRDGAIRRSSLSFQPGYQFGSNLGWIGATVWAVGSKQSVRHELVRDAARDWAILVLDRAPPDVRPLRLDGRSFETLGLGEPRLLLPAYSNDIAGTEAVSLDPSCSVRNLIWDTLVHDCMAAAGSSGAPLLMRDGREYVVVGIHVASLFASDEDGRVAELVGNQAVGSWMFETAASALVRKLNGDPVQAVNSGEY